MAPSVESTQLLLVLAVSLLTLNSRVAAVDCDCHPVPKNFNETVNDNVYSNCGKFYSYTYEFDKKQDWAAHLCISSTKVSAQSPLLIAVRESLAVMSFQVPLIFEGVQPFTTVCRTLCPLGNYFGSKIPPGPQVIFVEITTSSLKPVDFEVSMSTVNNFVVDTDLSLTVNITPSEPRVLQYNMETDLRAVRIEATSNDGKCMLLAIQDLKCPFFDSERTVEYKGFYQTLTTQSGISITRKTFGGHLYVVLILKPTDDDCLEESRRSTNGTGHRSKSVNLRFIPAITDEEYYGAVIGAFGFYILIYIFCLVICCFFYVRKKRNPEARHIDIECPSIQNYGSSSDSENPASMHDLAERRSSSPIDETDMDKLPDASHDKNVVRTKTIVFVADLATKDDRYISRRTKVFSWNLVTIAVFYGLPVVQLVYINQKIVNYTGNQDLCYYNFLCSHQVGVFSDFNHVYSNIGYIMLGILFLSLVWRREVIFSAYEHERRITANPGELTGIPNHFGLMYAMGWALIMEGILSGSYHVCPNKSNFQFDTAFMYIIATICMLKLYHARHSDITVKSHTTWMVLAIVVMLGVGGVLNGGLLFWILFVIAHLIVTFIVTAKIYYMGRCKINTSVFKRMYHTVKMDIISGSFRPMYLGRFCMLTIAVLLNLAVDLMGLIKRPSNFGSFLLGAFIMNLLLYLLYYTVMKIRYREGIRWIPIMYILLSFLCWGAALNFFLAKNTSWQVTPAQSRQRNKHCRILNFFDDHDIWHFLSSCALFFSFMVLFTLDDDLQNTPRTEIIVF